jgi:hypothetical protein
MRNSADCLVSPMKNTLAFILLIADLVIFSLELGKVVTENAQ